MVDELVFATQNANKVREIQHVISDRIRVLSLSDLGFAGDIPEEKPTLEGNALFKSKFIYQQFGKDCFADDSGLEVEALNGEPGVFSARYAALTGEIMEGEEVSSANIRKLLRVLEGQVNRRAQFRTIISLIRDGKQQMFEGIVTGQIITELRGEEGFGYDPVFLPDGSTRTFAEMDLQEKNKISHRAMAMRKLSDFLVRN